MDYETKRVESEIEIKTFVTKMKHALENGAEISFQTERIVDTERDEKYTNKFTIPNLFPDEDPKIVLRRELLSLSYKDYLHTVKDTRFPKKNEMRTFGKTYNENDDVYIKVRVELINTDYSGQHTVFVMSFHFAEWKFDKSCFPYKD